MFRTDFYLTALKLLFLLMISCNGEDEHKKQQGRVIEPDHIVTIYDDDEVVTLVNVALARTASERSTGLMEVFKMPFDTGMLFLFDEERLLSFWMENTPLTLDIIFINSNREIVRIWPFTTPYSRESIPSEYPSQYVLEVNGGFTRNFDIREGMRIDWKKK